MTSSIDRRHFLKTSAVIAAAAGTGEALAADPAKPQEFYELRAYRAPTAEKKTMVGSYLEGALLPALGRMGLDRIGVFAPLDEPEDHSVYVLIPYPTLDHFSKMSSTLLADEAFQAAAKGHFDVPKDDPVFTRIQSRFYKAFAGMPVIEMPAHTAGKKPRIFELRIYESHTEEKAALKVDMFNTGEIQVMRDVNLGPVFFGEALIGDDVPNLTYMLSAANREEHKAHWDAFRDHPEWNRMKDLPKYADTVSKITSIFLAPTAYSQI